MGRGNRSGSTGKKFTISSPLFIRKESITEEEINSNIEYAIGQEKWSLPYELLKQKDPRFVSADKTVRNSAQDQYLEYLLKNPLNEDEHLGDELLSNLLTQRFIEAGSSHDFANQIKDSRVGWLDASMDVTVHDALLDPAAFKEAFNKSVLIDYSDAEQRYIKEFKDLNEYNKDDLNFENQILPKMLKEEYYSVIENLGGGKEAFIRRNTPKSGKELENSKKIIDTVNYIGGLNSRYGGAKNTQDINRMAMSWQTRNSYKKFINEDAGNNPEVISLAKKSRRRI